MNINYLARWIFLSTAILFRFAAKLHRCNLIVFSRKEIAFRDARRFCRHRTCAHGRMLPNGHPAIRSRFSILVDFAIYQWTTTNVSNCRARVLSAWGPITLETRYEFAREFHFLSSFILPASAWSAWRKVTHACKISPEPAFAHCDAFERFVDVSRESWVSVLLTRCVRKGESRSQHW